MNFLAIKCQARYRITYFRPITNTTFQNPIDTIEAHIKLN